MRRFLGRGALFPLAVGRRFDLLARSRVCYAPLSVPSSPPLRLTTDELEKIVRLVENDPRILMEVVAKLEPENRRRLVVTGGAMEWFGKDSAAREVEQADQDQDRQISPKDFDHWFEIALKRRQEERKKKVEVQQQSANPPSKLAEPVGAASAQVPLKVLVLIAVEAGLPFVGFGFLDNATMILIGDAIDGTLGFYLNCSVLASAAMGNVCSGALSMQIHGIIEKALQRFNFDIPVLTEEQMKNRRVFLAGHIGGTIGIMVGLILGMTPLLFLEGDTSEKADYAVFQRWDKNGSGSIELPEFEKVLTELGLMETHEQAARIIEKYGEGGKVDFEQFSKMRADLREGNPIFD